LTEQEQIPWALADWALKVQRTKERTVNKNDMRSNDPKERPIEQWQASDLTGELNERASEPGAKPTTSQPTTTNISI